MERGSGVLLAVSSLPGDFGIGTLGHAAYDFIDFLQKARQKYWQILPLTETGLGASPYQSVSAFAGNINYIDFELLYEDGLLSKDELADCKNAFENCELADIASQSKKEELLLPAYVRARGRFCEEIAAFCEKNKFWLGDYALYKAANKRGAFSEELKKRDENAIKTAENELKNDINFYVFTQFIFDRQWQAVKKYANDRGIKIIGDMPIYVSNDSADVWSHPQWFQKNAVAGCPPDYFDKNGQNWGNPLYDWEALRENGYGFWIERFARAFDMCDLVRLDHFRGFEAYWAIPKNAKSAKEGHWEQGPGNAFFDMLKGWFGGLPVIAEDLGTLTPSFFEFMKKTGFPGLKVLEFAFAPYENSIYLPHNHEKNGVVYTGTHDNDTLVGWFSKLEKSEKDYLCAYLCGCTAENICEKLINTAYSSVCEVCIIPMQDILHQGSESRMNTPGTVGDGNWRYRIKKEALSEKLARELAEKVKIYAR